MTKIRDVNSEIKALDIAIDKAIIIQVLNSVNSYFAQFVGILSHEVREKKSFILLKVLPNC